MDNLERINFVVIACVLVVLVSLLVAGVKVASSEEGKVDLLSPKKHPGTAWAIRLWAIWWASILLTYLGLSALPYGAVLLLLDIGNLATIGTAIAYCFGNEFDLCYLKSLSYVLFFEAVWHISLPTLLNSPQGRLVVISPSVALSTLSGVSLGWAVVVRCGWRAWPFLMLTALYSVAQLPAYIDRIVLSEEVADSTLRGYFPKLSVVMVLLGLGKVLKVCMFLGYYYSPDQRPSLFAVKRFLPSAAQGVGMHPKMARFFRWVIGIIVAAFLGGLGAASVPSITQWLRSLLGPLVG